MAGSVLKHVSGYAELYHSRVLGRRQSVTCVVLNRIR